MKQFDDFIKKNTQKEIQVPDELSWDNMNIPIPKKKKRRFLPFFLLCLGFLIGVGATLFWLTKQDAHNTSTISQANFQTSIPEQIPTTSHSIEASTATTTNNDVQEEKIESIENISKGADFNIKLKKEAPQASTAKKNSKHNILNSTTILNKEQHPRLISKEELVETDFSENKYNNNLNDPLLLPTCPKLGIVNSHLDSLATINRLPISLLPLKTRSLPKSNNSDKIIEPTSPSRLSIYFASGYLRTNNHYKKGPQTETLSTAETTGHGMALNLGIRFKLNKTLFLTSEFSYQKLSSFFMYTENLGTETDPTQFKQVTRLRHICHNNSIETLGLNIGLGKDFLLGRQWGSQMILAFSSNYQLKSNGRMINDDLSVYDMSNHQYPERIIYNLHLSTGAFFQFKKFKLIGSIAWQQGLNSVRLLDNSDLEFSPSALNLSLGIEKRL
ncbi:MAG: hypothetical protein AAGH46_04380 [Bacteroidota bacterium]